MDLSPDETAAALRGLLAFYAEAGVDEALADEPVDRFAETLEAKARRASSATRAEARPGGDQGSREAEPGRAAPRKSFLPEAPPTAAPRPQTAAVPDGAQAALARELARSAGTLEELRRIMFDFDGCNLKATAKNLVFADGNPEADLMLVGEAPGRDEDIEGLPFVGRSGQLLDRILAAIDRDRTSAYIANVIPWRPPGNRDPSPMETEICRPFIERQIELAAPKVLITLGNPSTKALLRTQEGITRMRGTWREHVTPGGVRIPTMPTLHPAYLLRNPAHKRLAWRDFLEVRARLATFS
ncbi:uracil-DNA glycosylase family protein [Mesorhizobium sp. LHD-90]|uniref:uracil-DNA glycosylase n=1 Tax=Mesorhizobium sp. LHD-90 TaxID=3071414 RepID=UPI0027DF4FAE|nr:uracil-DNA glycosylase family protein [Mesorhizobium sp. LHD-90]MDQ6436917.1 uracil-DNA glycosylase family protein [Mesorhizobium sp. LHD-90]